MSKRSAALRYYRSYKPESKSGRIFRRLLRFVIILFFLRFILFSFLLSGYSVHTESSLPGLELGERLIASPLPYGPRLPFTTMHLPELRSPKRGDLVVYRTPANPDPAWWQTLLNEPYRFLSGEKARKLPFAREEVDAELAIGRVIGLPGDKIIMRDGRIYIKEEGSPTYRPERQLVGGDYRIQPLELPDNWEEPLPFVGESEELLIEADHLFILNDNRSLLSDDRIWGPSSRDSLVAKVLFSYWPDFSLL